MWNCKIARGWAKWKILNMFYLIIYWTQKVHNDFIFLCSIILPPVGHSPNHEYHCWNLQDNRAVVRIFIALLRFSVDSPSYISKWVRKVAIGGVGLVNKKSEIAGYSLFEGTTGENIGFQPGETGTQWTRYFLNILLIKLNCVP